MFVPVLYKDISKFKEPALIALLIYWPLTYGPGPYAPGEHAQGYVPGPLIIWKNILSQICSRTIRS